MNCLNQKCHQDPLKSINKICVTPDGDFVCDKSCKQFYEQQKSKFFNETIHDESKVDSYLRGE